MKGQLQFGNCAFRHGQVTKEVLSEHLQHVSKLEHIAQLQAVFHRYHFPPSSSAFAVLCVVLTRCCQAVAEFCSEACSTPPRRCDPRHSHFRSSIDPYADSLSDHIARTVIPSRRRWFESLVQSLQPVDMQFGSSRVVAETVKTMSQDVVFGLIELVQKVWLAEWRGADVGSFLRAVMLLLKLRPGNSDVIVSSLVQVASRASPHNCFSFYKPGRHSVHAFGASFWLHFPTPFLSEVPFPSSLSSLPPL
jgi:hypothetical protein